MILKDTNKYNTDLAWNKLHRRLEQENLLDSNKHVKSSISYSRLKWVAAIVIICLGIAYLATENYLKTNQEMLTLTNQDDSSTLISTLEDGSTIYLSAKSSLDYPLHFNDKERLVKLSGDAYFDIQKDIKPFVVETKNLKIEVLGTAFNVKDEELVSVSVKRGKVRVTDKVNKRSVVVEAGETAILQADNLETMQTKDLSQFSNYLSYVTFKDERLENIVKVLNVRSDSIHIDLDSDIKDRLLTMSFSDETNDDLISYVCVVLNLDYTKKGNSIRIINKMKNEP